MAETIANVLTGVATLAVDAPAENRAEWSDEQVSALTGDTIAVIQEHYMTPSKDEMKEVTEMKPII